MTEATYRRYSLKSVRTVLTVAEETSRYIKTAADAVTWARALYDQLDKGVEHFSIIALDAKGHVNGWKCVHTGILTSTLVHPREVFFYAIGMKAAKIILVHNHPSGDPTPSRQDHGITTQLANVGDMVGIPVVEHLILAEGPRGGKRWFSFKDHKLL